MLVKMWEFFLQAFIANPKETYEGKKIMGPIVVIKL
jgi:hypothetical protein